MKNFRKHGEAPYRIGVVHGGPGAAGEMAPVAQELAAEWGVLEPYQTAMSLQGQIDELADALEAQADGPMTLIGFSWGAWLSYFVTATNQKLVKKLILVGSAPFEEAYAASIQDTRFSRMNQQDRTELKNLLSRFDATESRDKNAALGQIGAFFEKLDAYKTGSHQPDAINFQADIFQSVWKEAAIRRRQGQLLTYGNDIQCPVVALHGDYDPHPAEGVEKPLSRVVPNFRFVLLKNCGHKPWIEEDARSAFFRALRREIGQPDP